MRYTARTPSIFLELHARTQAHVAANIYVAPGAEAGAEDGGHSDHD